MKVTPETVPTEGLDQFCDRRVAAKQLTGPDVESRVLRAASGVSESGLHVSDSGYRYRMVRNALYRVQAALETHW